MACIAAAGAAVGLDRWSPPPSADVARGSEACFGTGLLDRELVQPGGIVQRWAGERARFLFRYLPQGPLTLAVEVHGQRAPVAVVAAGAILGTIEPKATGASFDQDALRRLVHRGLSPLAPRGRSPMLAYAAGA